MRAARPVPKAAKSSVAQRRSPGGRLVIQRIGQDVFRQALMDYWGGRCPLTGITEPALLRAPHIIPWADCTDAQRLDVHNWLLLSALWDAAFDQGLVSFADDGAVLAIRSSMRPRARSSVPKQRCRFTASATRIEQISRCIARVIDFQSGPLRCGTPGLL